MIRKAIILAGGLGTRLMEETEAKPKPMVEIGGKPILWHIMKSYHAHGIGEFVICLGYKGYVIKEYFANYFLHNADVTFAFQDNSSVIHTSAAEPWKVTLIDTGADTMTGGRLKRVRKEVAGETAFCFTYGDAVSDLDIGASLKFHAAHGGLATVTAVQPAARFGALEMQGDRVTGFREKPAGGNQWINGGYFVLSPKVLDHIDGNSTTWEREPMEALARADQLRAFRHDGFWQPMDTLREKRQLEELWATGNAPWKVW